MLNTSYLAGFSWCTNDSNGYCAGTYAISPHATYHDGSSVGGPYYIEANDEWYPIIAPTGYQSNEGYNNPLIYFYYPSVTGKYAVTISLPVTQGGGSWEVYEYELF